MRKQAAVVVASMLCAGLAACGSDSGDVSTPAGEGGASIKLTLIADQTGAASFAAQPAIEGAKFAIDEANASGEFGGKKFVLNVKDTGSDPQQASALMTKEAQSDTVGTMFAVTGAGGLATAPIAQRAKLPLVLIQSGSPGTVETGEYIFRTTAPQDAIHQIQAADIKARGAKRVAVAFHNDIPTLKALAEDFYPKQAGSQGFDIVSTDGAGSTETDYTGLASKVAAKNPDYVLGLVQGPGGVTFLTQLRRAGYKGPIGAAVSVSGGLLKPMGSAGDGITYPMDFVAGAPSPSSQEFEKRWRAAKKSAPNNYNAEGYDAARLILDGAKLAGTDDLSRDSLKDGITKVTEAGMAGAVGRITFEERDARVDGVLAANDNGVDKPAESDR